MKEKILMAVAQEIKNRGIKFTIDNVAVRLGISKKTIYQYFSSKDEIITQVIELALVDVEGQEQEILAGKETDFVEKIGALILLTPKIFGPIDDWIMADIERYRSQDWERIEKFKYERMLVLSQLLEEGIDLGIVRTMNAKVAARLLLGACRELSQYKFLEENNLNSIEARRLLTEVFLYGILAKSKLKSEEGLMCNE